MITAAVDRVPHIGRCQDPDQCTVYCSDSVGCVCDLDTLDRNIVYANHDAIIQPLLDLSDFKEVWEYCITESPTDENIAELPPGETITKSPEPARVGSIQSMLLEPKKLTPSEDLSIVSHVSATNDLVSQTSSVSNILNQILNSFLSMFQRQNHRDVILEHSDQNSP